MKNLLIATSSALTLTLSSGINSLISHNDTNVKITNNAILAGATFNNYYEALGNSSFIITNQSKSDGSYISYDLKNANYALPDSQTKACIYFMVDNYGILQYRDNVNSLSSSDKNALDNIKTTIVKTKKVSTALSNYNPFSSSIYNPTYFLNPPNSWQYLQLGGLEKPVNIYTPSRPDTKLIQNSSNLNEALGFYYIAKAFRANRITHKLAVDIAKLFINKSSLANSLGKSPSLIEQIMNLLDYNNTVYNWILQTPIYNSYKNYSLNFIFDSNNELVAIYYNNWKKSSYYNMADLNFYEAFNGTSSNLSINDPNSTYLYNRTVSPVTILNWRNYANSWADFSRLFATLTFQKNSHISIGSQNYYSTSTDLSNKSIDTCSIKENNTNTHYYEVKLYYPEATIFNAYINFSAWISAWHDNNYLYLNFGMGGISHKATSSIALDVSIPNITLNNSME